MRSILPFKREKPIDKYKITMCKDKTFNVHYKFLIHKFSEIFIFRSNMIKMQPHRLIQDWQKHTAFSLIVFKNQLDKSNITHWCPNK